MISTRTAFLAEISGSMTILVHEFYNLVVRNGTIKRFEGTVVFIVDKINSNGQGNDNGGQDSHRYDKEAKVILMRSQYSIYSGDCADKHTEAYNHCKPEPHLTHFCIF